MQYLSTVYEGPARKWSIPDIKMNLLVIYSDKMESPREFLDYAYR